METLRIYTDDLQIAKSIINRDERITRQFFYIHCYPLFKSIYDNYYTDCANVKEFIDEIYILTVAPSKKTGRCQMENYKGESTFTTWLKTVCLFYCYKKYKRKMRMPILNSFYTSDAEYDDVNDRFIERGGSIEMNFDGLNREDTEKILGLMPNERYRSLIRMRYLELLTNEETAKELGLTMANYYNIHKRAKAQFESICRKEDYYG